MLYKEYSVQAVLQCNIILLQYTVHSIQECTVEESVAGDAVPGSSSTCGEYSIHYSTVYSTQSSTVQYTVHSTVQYSIQYSTIYSTVQYTV